MLSDTLRAGAESKLFKIILFLIILSFIFTGVGGYLIPRLNTDPVEVGEYKISANDWNNQYNDQAQMLQRAYGAQAVTLLENPEYVKSLKTKILESMVDTLAFNAAVYDNNVRIGDEQVKDLIRKNPAFQKDGKFDNELYRATIRNSGMSPDYYAEQLRTALMSATVADPLQRLGASAFDFEVDNLTKLLSKVRYVDLYSLDVKSLESTIKVSDEDMKSFYDANQDKFMSKATSKFNYIILDFNVIKETIKPTDDNLVEYYNMHQDEFKADAKRSAYHLVVNKDNESKIEQIENDLKTMSFIDVAKKYNLDSAHINLGTVTKNDVQEEIAGPLFALDEGKVSDKIFLDNSIHFVMAYKVFEDVIKPYDKVKSQVLDLYTNDLARQKFNEQVQTLSDLSFENPDSLDITAQALSLNIQDSGALEYGDLSAKWPLNTKSIQDAAFSDENISSNMNSSAINISDDVVAVINIYEHTASAIKDFNEVKDEALKLTLASLVDTKGHELLQSVAKQIIDGNEIETNGVVVKESKNVKISHGNARIDPAFGLAVFSIENAKNTYAIASNKGVPTLAMFVEEKIDKDLEDGLYESAVKAQIMQVNHQNSGVLMHKGARDLIDIKYNDDAINMVIKSQENIE